MIHTQTDFCSKVTKEIREKYFPNESHGITYNKKYWGATQCIEDFSNGCLVYGIFIRRLSRNCNEKSSVIHSIVEKYVISFGGYTFKPSK